MGNSQQTCGGSVPGNLIVLLEKTDTLIKHFCIDRRGKNERRILVAWNKRFVFIRTAQKKFGSVHHHITSSRSIQSLDLVLSARARKPFTPILSGSLFPLLDWRCVLCGNKHNRCKRLSASLNKKITLCGLLFQQARATTSSNITLCSYVHIFAKNFKIRDYYIQDRKSV